MAEFVFFAELPRVHKSPCSCGASECIFEPVDEYGCALTPEPACTVKLYSVSKVRPPVSPDIDPELVAEREYFQSARKAKRFGGIGDSSIVDVGIHMELFGSLVFVLDHGGIGCFTDNGGSVPCAAAYGHRALDFDVGKLHYCSYRFPDCSLRAICSSLSIPYDDLMFTLFGRPSERLAVRLMQSNKAFVESFVPAARREVSPFLPARTCTLISPALLHVESPHLYATCARSDTTIVTSGHAYLEYAQLIRQRADGCQFRLQFSRGVDYRWNCGPVHPQPQLLVRTNEGQWGQLRVAFPWSASDERAEKLLPLRAIVDCEGVVGDTLVSPLAVRTFLSGGASVLLLSSDIAEAIAYQQQRIDSFFESYVPARSVPANVYASYLDEFGYYRAHNLHQRTRARLKADKVAAALRNGLLRERPFRASSRDRKRARRDKFERSGVIPSFVSEVNEDEAVLRAASEFEALAAAKAEAVPMADDEDTYTLLDVLRDFFQGVGDSRGAKFFYELAGSASDFLRPFIAPLLDAISSLASSGFSSVASAYRFASSFFSSRPCLVTPPASEGQPTTDPTGAVLHCGGLKILVDLKQCPYQLPDIIGSLHDTVPALRPGSVDVELPSVAGVTFITNETWNLQVPRIFLNPPVPRADSRMMLYFSFIKNIDASVTILQKVYNALVKRQTRLDQDETLAFIGPRLRTMHQVLLSPIKPKMEQVVEYTAQAITWHTRLWELGLSRHPLYQQCGEVLVLLRSCLATLEAGSVMGKTKVQCPWVVISGRPGVGKDNAVKLMASCFCEHDQQCARSPVPVYYRSPGDPYWSGQCGHKVFVFQDAFQDARTDNRADESLVMIHMVSSSPMLISGASIESKGQMCAPLVVFSTTNSSSEDCFYAGGALVDQQALRRRITFWYEMVGPDEFHLKFANDVSRQPPQIVNAAQLMGIVEEEAHYRQRWAAARPTSMVPILPDPVPLADFDPVSIVSSIGYLACFAALVGSVQDALTSLTAAGGAAVLSLESMERSISDAAAGVSLAAGELASLPQRLVALIGTYLRAAYSYLEEHRAICFLIGFSVIATALMLLLGRSAVTMSNPYGGDEKIVRLRRGFKLPSRWIARDAAPLSAPLRRFEHNSVHYVTADVPFGNSGGCHAFSVAPTVLVVPYHLVMAPKAEPTANGVASRGVLHVDTQIFRLEDCKAVRMMEPCNDLVLLEVPTQIPFAAATLCPESEFPVSPDAELVALRGVTHFLGVLEHSRLEYVAKSETREKLFVDPAWKASKPLRVGMCGAPWVWRGYAIGTLVAGYDGGDSFGAPLTAEMVADGISALQPEGVLHASTDVVTSGIAAFPTMTPAEAQVPPHRTAVRKSKFVFSPAYKMAAEMCDKWGCTPTVPLVTVDKTLTAEKIYATRTRRDYRYTPEERALVRALYRRELPKVKLARKSWSTVVSQLPTDTSPGIPYTTSGLTEKRKLFALHQDGSLDPEHPHPLLDRHMRELSESRGLCASGTKIKDNCDKPTKLPRAFEPIPAHLHLAQEMDIGVVKDWAVEHHRGSHFACGVRVDSDEWGEIKRRFLDKELCGCADAIALDWNESCDVLQEAYLASQECVDYDIPLDSPYGVDPDYIRERICGLPRVLDGKVVFMNGVGPSGQPTTVFLNDLCMHSTLVLGFRECLSKLGLPTDLDFILAHFDFITYGDDCLYTWDIPEITPGMLMRAFSNRGITFTWADKQPHPDDFVPERDQFTFLKRNFLALDGVVIGQLEKQSILRSLSFCVSDDPDGRFYSQRVEAALREASLHSEEFFLDCRALGAHTLQLNKCAYCPGVNPQTLPDYFPLRCAFISNFSARPEPRANASLLMIGILFFLFAYFSGGAILDAAVNSFFPGAGVLTAWWRSACRRFQRLQYVSTALLASVNFLFLVFVPQCFAVSLIGWIDIVQGRDWITGFHTRVSTAIRWTSGGVGWMMRYTLPERWWPRRSGPFSALGIPWSEVQGHTLAEIRVSALAHFAERIANPLDRRLAQGDVLTAAEEEQVAQLQTQLNRILQATSTRSLMYMERFAFEVFPLGRALYGAVAEDEVDRVVESVFVTVAAAGGLALSVEILVAGVKIFLLGLFL